MHLPWHHFRVFSGYLFVYLNLVSVYFTHSNITFCLPPSVIFHFYVTRFYQNVFYFTSLAPRSIFVYLAYFLVPRDIFLLTWLFILVLFDYPIICWTYFLCTLPLSKSGLRAGTISFLCWCLGWLHVNTSPSIAVLANMPNWRLAIILYKFCGVETDYFPITPGGFACWSIGGFIPSSTDCGDELGVWKSNLVVMIS